MSAPGRRGAFGPRSIRFRIAAAFAVAFVAMVSAQAWLIRQQRPLNDSLRLVTEGYLPLARQVASLKADQQRVQRDLNRLSRDRPRPVTGETSAAEIYTEELKDNLAIARIHAESLRDRPLDAEEVGVLSKTLAYLNTIESLFARYEQQSAEYLQLADAQRLEEARETLRKPLRTTSKQLAEEFEKLERTLEQRITEVTRATEQRQAEATAVALALTLGATLVGVAMLAAGFVALRPITRLTVEVQRVAEGEVGARVEVGGDDEVALLAEEFNAMAQAIEQRDRRLKERAEQLKVLSRYLGSVVDSLDDGLFVVEEGAVTLANPAAVRIFGVEAEQPPPALVGDVLQPGRHELRHDDRLFAARAVRFGDDGVVVVLSDVTEQTQAQEQLARSERLALVGQMLAQVTHEVRNPLNALSLNTELLGDELERLDPERATEAWDVLALMAREVERLTDVTAHYLQLARRPPASLRTADLVAVLRDVARLLGPELDEAGVSLSLDLEPQPAQLADGDQLRQAVLNAVRNAVEAGGKHLAIGLRRDGAELHLWVEDDGEGMSDQALSQATEPFFTTRPTGTGLGLAVSRQILDDHDGQLEIASTRGEGTRITFVLPWRPAGASESEIASTG